MTEPTPARIPPVIIMGMHRSGTSMVARALERLGLFLGWRREPNEEAIFFYKLNVWLLNQVGSRWDRPPPHEAWPIDPRILKATTLYLTRLLRSVRVISFLGPTRWLRWATPFKISQPWGWKDPRNTLTLSYWDSVFPDSRIIHVTRHGVDVARSLQQREQERLRRNEASLESLRWLYPWRPKRSGFVESVRCLSLEGGLSLWSDYLQRAEIEVAQWGARAFVVRFEELLAEPCSQLADLAHFCRLSPPRDALEDTARAFDPRRALAYRQDPELRQFASQWGEVLRRWGYEI